MDAPRVRFAPSPTGFIHVGSARTALFNWLFARRHGGTYLLRIEDTDETRNREEWVDGILESMAWLGLMPDEPPVRQTQFTDAHVAAAERLFDGGRLYGCDCTREAIDARTKGTGATGYDGFCRDRGLTRGPGVALRFRVPDDDGVTVVHDLIRGDVSFRHDAIEDFAVVRSDGRALFALANLVDDRAMAITHVVRGEEHLANTPKQLLLGDALDELDRTVTPTPVFAHVPLLVNEKRQKLSKRRDPVALESYRDRGFLAGAMLNFLALLGWSPAGGDETLVSKEEMVPQFALEDVNNSPAFFDVAKLTHLNGEYLRAMSPGDFIEACAPWVAPGAEGWAPAEARPPWSPERFVPDRFARIAPLVQERVSTLDEVPRMIDFLFLEDAPIDPKDFERGVRDAPKARDVLVGVLEALPSVEFEAASLHELLAAVGESLGLPLRRAQAPVRVAVTGRSVGPPLFESMAILGRDEVRRRLERTLTMLD